jgi:hypothetical protein
MICFSWAKRFGAKKEKKRLTTEKNKCVRLMNIKKKVKKVLEKKGDDEKCFLGSDLDAVLAHYNCLCWKNLLGLLPIPKFVTISR